MSDKTEDNKQAQPRPITTTQELVTAFKQLFHDTLLVNEKILIKELEFMDPKMKGDYENYIKSQMAMEMGSHVYTSGRMHFEEVPKPEGFEDSPRRIQTKLMILSGDQIETFKKLVELIPSILLDSYMKAKE